MAGNTSPMSYDEYKESLSADEQALLEYKEKLTAATDEQLSDPRLLRNAATYHHASEVVIEQTRRGIRANDFEFVDSSKGTAVITSQPGTARLMTTEELIEYNETANPQLAADAKRRGDEEANQDLQPVVEDQSRLGEGASIGAAE